MLKIDPPNFKFCPICAQNLSIRLEEGKERKYCKSCGWVYYPRVSMAPIAIIEKNGKVLMVQRKKEPYKGTWMFPSGFVDYGEHPEDTVIREVKEETGLDVINMELLEIAQTDDDPREPGNIVIFYKVTVKEGQVVNDPYENLDIKWFDIDNLPDIGWKNHKKMAEKLFGYNR